MKKFVLAVLLTSMVGVSLMGCGSKEANGNNTKSSNKNELNVYTARSESLNNLVISNFEKDTGIKVNVVVAGTGELQKRVASEKNNPLGDILWAADETMLSSSKDLFMQYVSPEDKNMEEKFRNKSGYFTPCFSDPTVFIVNKNLIGDIKVEGFKDLLNPDLKGKIAFGDPTNSSSAFQILMAMLYDMGKNGDPMSDEAWNYVDKLLANLDGKMASSSGQLHKSVADGEYPVGLTWEDPVANYIKNGAPVKVVFPSEGAIFPAESVQIIKNCKNPENAKKFVDYLLSEKIQNAVGTELTVRPLRKGAKLASYMTPLDKIKITPSYDEKWVTENKTKVTAKFNEHIEKIKK